MGQIFSFFKDKCQEKKQLCREERLWRLIINAHLAKNKDDYSIVKYYADKERIEYAIMSNYGWERTPSGFEYRSNYRFDEENNEITFDRCNITRIKGGFQSDDSEIANSFMKRHSRLLLNLEKDYQALDNLYLQYESSIKGKIDEYDKLRELYGFGFRVVENAHGMAVHSHNYLYIYGELGKELLIKWLNKLNSEEDIESLVEEYKADVFEANKYYEGKLDDHYLKYYKFEYWLLQELIIYSPRGKYFKWAYKNNLEKEDTKGKKK